MKKTFTWDVNLGASYEVSRHEYEAWRKEVFSDELPLGRRIDLLKPGKYAAIDVRFDETMITQVFAVGNGNGPTLVSIARGAVIGYFPIASPNLSKNQVIGVVTQGNQTTLNTFNADSAKGKQTELNIDNFEARLATVLRPFSGSPITVVYGQEPILGGHLLKVFGHSPIGAFHLESKSLPINSNKFKYELIKSEDSRYIALVPIGKAEGETPLLIYEISENGKMRLVLQLDLTKIDRPNIKIEDVLAGSHSERVIPKFIPGGHQLWVPISAMLTRLVPGYGNEHIWEKGILEIK